VVLDTSSGIFQPGKIEYQNEEANLSIFIAAKVD
jgi:hypothetical protein